ncbi:hypothetical protein [uncultured Vagococcus sp.]|uniref:hypothetical protein n=1 Tax=uncultured Vagococcus sp. TaxID=189676 RepID=UPI0028D290AA|nr:hypothetical protein [uncultured Vagococcus sp.]
MSSIFRNIIDFLVLSAPVSIMTNIGLGVILLIIGVSLAVTKKTKGKKIGAITCLTLSGLAFVGSASTWFVSTFIF